MKIFTSHLRDGTAPVLVREGFSWGAFFWGFLWLFAHGAWIAGLLDLAVAVPVMGAVARTGSAAPFVGLLVLQGMFGRDLVRWGLERRGFSPGPVLAERDRDRAYARLFAVRPDIGTALGAARL